MKIYNIALLCFITTCPGLLVTASQAQSVFNVKDYGATGNGSSDDGAAILKAIDAAEATTVNGSTNACVYFPAGDYLVGSAIKLATSTYTYYDINGNAAYTTQHTFTQGAIVFKGDGRKVSVIIQKGAADGIDCDLSGGSTPWDNTVTVEKLGLLGANPNCGTALSVSYGTGDYAGKSVTAGSCVSHIEINGSGLNNGWNKGCTFLNCQGLHVDDVYASGDTSDSGSYESPGSGPGAGWGMDFDSCVNCLASNCLLYWWNKGWYLPSGSVTNVGPSQGVQLNNIMALECCNCIYSNGATVYVTNFLFDNGNLNVSSHQSVYIANAISSYLSSGQILQDAGGAQLEVYNTNGLTVNNVDFKNRNNLGSTPAVWFTGGCNGATVTGCNFGGGTAVQCDSGSQGIVAQNNAWGTSANIDNGVNNKLGECKGFTTVFTTAGGSPIDLHYLDISSCHLGKKPDGATVQVTNDQNITAQYNWDDTGNSANQMAIQLFYRQGGNLPSGVNFRVTVRVGP